MLFSHYFYISELCKFVVACVVFIDLFYWGYQNIYFTHLNRIEKRRTNIYQPDIENGDCEDK